MRTVKEKDVLAIDTASDSTTNKVVPARKSVFLPSVSARPPASRRKAPLTSLLDGEKFSGKEAKVHEDDSQLLTRTWKPAIATHRLQYRGLHR